MNVPNILHEFNQNSCELKVQIEKRGQIVTNCDIFINESSFILVSDADISRFECPRRFDLKSMKDIPISFNTERWEYTCLLPCCPDSDKPYKPDQGAKESINKNMTLPETWEAGLSKYTRITDSCVLSVDGKICEIRADFPYGFSGLYRGKPKYNEDDLSHICRITDPSCLSSVKRIIQRESDEIEDFCPDQYKINFAELPIPEGHENPIEYTILYDDTKLSNDEEYILSKIRCKYASIDIEIDQKNVDCGLVSILMGICYDTRLTSNEPTCESAWTRTILSPALSYFEQFDNLRFVVESFLRRSLIYPLYRNYDLSRLCVDDAVAALQKGKAWILKQLLGTYNCFCESDYNRKALNKYFIKHYIWYVDTVDDEHLGRLSMNLESELSSTTKTHLRLGLDEIEFEMVREIMDDFSLDLSQELQGLVIE